MTGFVFKFRKVLKVKGIKEEIRRHELLRLRAAEEKEKECLNQMQEKRADHYSAQRKEIRETLTAAKLRLYHEYSVVLNGLVSEQARVLADSTQAVAAGREKLVVARQETRVLSRLKDKHQARYRQAENRQEQKQTDEAAGTYYLRVNRNRD